MKSIPAKKLVDVIPGVLGTGGNPLSLNAVFGTDSTRVPIGTVPAFPSLAAVKAFFGSDSAEARMAAVYFNGFTNCTRLPGKLYFAQYNDAAVAGYLRSGSFAGVALTALQALSGTVIVSVDGRTVTSPSVNLASATSFSNAAALVQAGLQTAGSIFSGTASLAGTVMTVTATASGILHIGDAVVGTGITGGTTVASFGTYTAVSGVGTVNMSGAMTTEAAEAVTVTSTATVSYDAQLAEFVIHSPTTGDNSAVGFATGTLAAGLKLTSATGAVLSPGADATTPSDFLDGVVSVTQNWATFTTTFEPDDETMIGFASWVNSSSPAGSERFAYVGETTDVTLTEGPAPDSFTVLTADFNGRIAAYSNAGVDPYGNQAAFVCGMAASTNWAAINGRITYAYKNNSLLVPTVADETISDNLDANGVNYYGAYATANDEFQLFQTGQISGQWDWIDEYINQIYLNSQMQLALLAYLAQVNAVPYVDAGYNQLRGVLRTPISEALNNGSIVKGVVLSSGQIQALIAASGVDSIGVTLTQQGWFLQILDPGAIARGNRTTPNMTFWYTDGGAIQQLSLASIDVQ